MSTSRLPVDPSRSSVKSRRFIPYVASFALIACVTAFGWITQRVLRAPNIEIIYMLAVLVIALRWGRGPSILTAVVSVVVFDYCFVPPYSSFAVTDLAYLTSVSGFLIVGIATSALASRARELAIVKEARARAEARSEAKDEILNKISHELRSPLNALLGWSQLLAQTDDHDRAFKAAAHIERSGQLLARLVDDLMTTSRASSGKLLVDRSSIPLGPVVASAVSTMSAVAQQKGVEIQADIDPIGLVLADTQRIEQITINLLSNAIKFTPSGGSVSVQLHHRDSTAELVVSDTGIGIPTEFLPHVFEPFSQADSRNARSGLGLGMAIVDHLVSAHGGTISVVSDGQGRGTTFTIRLPMLAADDAVVTR